MNDKREGRASLELSICMYLVRDLYVYEYKVINEDDAKKGC